MESQYVAQLKDYEYIEEREVFKALSQCENILDGLARKLLTHRFRKRIIKVVVSIEDVFSEQLADEAMIALDAKTEERHGYRDD